MTGVAAAVAQALKGRNQQRRATPCVARISLASPRPASPRLASGVKHKAEIAALKQTLTQQQNLIADLAEMETVGITIENTFKRIFEQDNSDTQRLRSKTARFMAANKN
jgi:ABC-type uncharacterized transport system YnjBCD ATPase subunit